MPGVGDSGLLVVRLPLRTASEEIRDKLSTLAPEARLPRTASAIFSLANLTNLSRDRFDPPATDSAVTFLSALAPPRPATLDLTISDTALPPSDLLLPDRRRLPVLPVLVALAMSGIGFGATLGLVGLPAQPAEGREPPVEARVPLPTLAAEEEASPRPAPDPSTAILDRQPLDSSTVVLDRQQLERVMTRLRFRVRRCFERGHRRGRARVRVTVLASGEPRSVRVSSRAGRSVAACIRRQVRQTWFPPIGAPSMRIARTYRVR